ncbi:MAG: hypothetical protein WA152_01445 [Microgenomates group bacterium]
MGDLEGLEGEHNDTKLIKTLVVPPASNAMSKRGVVEMQGLGIETTGNVEVIHQRPDTLYRAFTVNPEDLSLGMFNKPLIPGSQDVEDSTRIGDGNELGVYMSTNLTMVEKVYASKGRVENAFVKTPRHYKDGGQVTGIDLPVCGLVIEVDTKKLEIREPKILPKWMGHYNNGFEGSEWIADEVPADNYKILKLVLSTHPNDSEKITIDVSDFNDEQKLEAINSIQAEFRRKKEEALEYKAFLENVDSSVRMNELTLKRKWVEHRQLK